jgi:hypothetical protein
MTDAMDRVDAPISEGGAMEPAGGAAAVKVRAEAGLEAVREELRHLREQRDGINARIRELVADEETLIQAVGVFNRAEARRNGTRPEPVEGGDD